MTDDVDTRGDHVESQRGGRRKKTVEVVEEYQRDLPFDPEEVASEELFEALEEIGRYDAHCTDKIYELSHDHVNKRIGPDDINVEDAPHLKQILQYAQENQPEWVRDIEEFIDQYFGDIEEDNFTSTGKRCTIDEPISPVEAKEYIQTRGRRLRKATEAAYGPSSEPPNDRLISIAQKAYLWNIWPAISNDEIVDRPEKVDKVVYTREAAKCYRCERAQGLIGKYDIWLCRQCFRSIARDMGFKKYS